MKDAVMYAAVLTKCQTHEAIRDKLLATGEQAIVENAHGDYYWGCGKDGSGLNKLGLILQQVRTALRQPA